MLKRIIVASCFALVGYSVGARAEIDKIMHFTDGAMHPEFRLKFSPPAKWTEDIAASKKNGLPIYVPAGTSFGSAPAVMYARVTYNSDRQSMDKYVEVAHQRWQAAELDVKIDPLANESRTNGSRPFRVYHFVNPSRPQQAYELMAYGEDKDKDGNNFFVMIGLSGATQDAIDKAEPSFRTALRNH